MIDTQDFHRKFDEIWLKFVFNLKSDPKNFRVNCFYQETFLMFNKVTQINNAIDEIRDILGSTNKKNEIYTKTR